MGTEKWESAFFFERIGPNKAISKTLTEAPPGQGRDSSFSRETGREVEYAQYGGRAWGRE